MATCTVRDKEPNVISNADGSFASLMKYIQLYFTRMVVNKQTSKLKHRMTKNKYKKLVNATR